MAVAAVDRLANPRELASARRRMFKANGGPGIHVAAQRLGMDAATLSLALRGLVPPARLLHLSDLRRMFTEEQTKRGAAEGG